jgi:hypothetical protein
MGLRALVLKNHHINTTDRAYFTMREVEGIDLFGSVVLNYVNGGINPFAADAAAQMGAKAVWLPTIDTVHQKDHYGSLGGYGGFQSPSLPPFYKKMEGIRIIDREGSVIPELVDVVEVCRDHGLFLGVGHVSHAEAGALVDQAQRMGFRKLVVDHPHLPFFNLSLELQQEWAGKGAWINHCVSEVTPKWYSVSIPTIVKNMRAVGLERCLISSDLGQLHNPMPGEGIRMYAQLLLEAGMTAEEIRTMMVTNPARVLYGEE